MPEDNTERSRHQREHRVLKKVNHEGFYFVGGGVDGIPLWLEWPPDQQSRDQAFLDALLRPHDMRHVVDLHVQNFGASIEGEAPNEFVHVYEESVRKTEADKWQTNELDNLRRRLDEYIGILESLQQSIRGVLMVWADEVGRPLLAWKEHHPHTPGETIPLPDDPWPAFFITVSRLWKNLFFIFFEQIRKDEEVEEVEEQRSMYFPEYIALRVQDTFQGFPHPALDASDNKVFAECQKAGVLYHLKKWREVRNLAHVVRAWIKGSEDTHRARYEGIRSKRWKSAREAVDRTQSAALEKWRETARKLQGFVGTSTPVRKLLPVFETAAVILVDENKMPPSNQVLWGMVEAIQFRDSKLDTETKSLKEYSDKVKPGKTLARRISRNLKNHEMEIPATPSEWRDLLAALREIRS